MKRRTRAIDPGHAVLAGLILLVLASVAPARAQNVPGVIAHRGVILDAPENTIPAIERAIELGCAMVEIDIRYSSDGRVILMHDDTLDRTTNGSGPVGDLNFTRIRQLDAGDDFGRDFRATRVPTLEEAIEVARGRIRLYLDMKVEDPRLAVELVGRLAAGDTVVFRPYSYEATDTIRTMDPTLDLLVDLEDWLRLPGVLALIQQQFPTAAISSGIRNWTEADLREARRLGLETYVNVLGADDTPENRDRAVRLGFDMIQTDYQELLLERLAGR
jgi:glycerophosphoryl diester phosphodiesterase